MDSVKVGETWDELGVSVPNGRRSGNIAVVCPECSGDRKKKNTKPLSINLDKGVGLCHHCQTKYALKTQQYKQPMQKEYARPEWSNITELSDALVGYFKGRGISQKVLLQFKIQQGRQFMPQAGKEVAVMMFPYILNGEVENIKYRGKHPDSGDKIFKLHTGAKLILYNLDAIKNSKEALIGEGEFAPLSWAEIGYGYALSVPNGAALSKNEKEQYELTGQFNDNNVLSLEYLDNSYEQIKHIEKWYIATDNDAPGLKLRRELIRRLGAEKCWIVEFGDCKDENEVLQNKGVLALEECLKNARPCPINGEVHLDSEWEYMQNKFNHGRPKGLKLGLPEFDGHYSIKQNEFLLINGWPGDGKTSFAMWLMMVTAVKYGWKWGVYSPENYPIGDLYDTLIEIYIGKTVELGMPNRMSFDEYAKGAEFVKTHFRAIDSVDPNEPLTLDGLLDVVKPMVMRYGINGYLIDPWNDLYHQKLPGETTEEYLQRQLSKIRRFKKMNNLYTIINAHPIALRRREDDGSKALPTPYDLAGGAMFYNRADNMITVYQNEQDRALYLTEIHIQKIKFQKLVGRPTPKDSPIVLKYDIQSNRYKSTTGEDALDALTKPMNTQPNIWNSYSADAQNEAAQSVRTMNRNRIDPDAANTIDDNVPF